MLDAGGPKAVEARAVLGPVEAGPGDLDLGGALDVVVDLGDREAAFLVDVFLVRGPDHLGVDQHHRARRCVVFLHAIHHQHALEHADLRRGQTDAGRVVHRFQHVIGQTRQLARIGDGVGHGFEPGIWMDEDVAYCHACDLSDGRSGGKMWGLRSGRGVVGSRDFSDRDG